MADFHAIGGVSATLKTLLDDRMELPDGVSGDQFTISVGPPPDEEGGNRVEDPRLNLFLFRVTENPHLENQDLPRANPSKAYGTPPLSLDLHYLVTAYGSTQAAGVRNETRAHFLLGSAMRVLHDHAVIDDGLAVRGSPSGQPVLHHTLRREPENVKLTLDPIEFEDLTQIWTALNLPFRPSAAYSVSVVQIESGRDRHYPRLVGEPRTGGGPKVRVGPHSVPHVERVGTRRPGDEADTVRDIPVARVGDTLVVEGRNLDRDPVHVELGPVAVPVGSSSSTRLEVTVPDDELPDGSPIPEDRRLRLGAVALRVARRMPDGSPGGPASNAVPVLVVPRVDAATYQEPDDRRAVQVDGLRLSADGSAGETILGDAVVDGSSYLEDADDGIVVPLPDTLPESSARVLASGQLDSFPDLPADPEVEVTIGTEGPHTATLPYRPDSVEAAARALETAVRGVDGDLPRFEETRVTTSGDRLVVVPGRLTRPATFSGPDATALRLTTASGAQQTESHLSGALDPFPSLTNPTPTVRARTSLDSFEASLDAAPASLEAASQALEDALEDEGAATLHVTTLDHQLVTLPLAPLTGPVTYEAVAGTDETTVRQLRLAVDRRVRVRVGGAESIDQIDLELPP